MYSAQQCDLSSILTRMGSNTLDQTQMQILGRRRIFKYKYEALKNSKYKCSLSNTNTIYFKIATLESFL